MALDRIYKTPRWSASVDDSGTCLKFQTARGTFSLGVGNDGEPYVSVDKMIIVRPAAANRIHIFEK